MSPYDAAPVSVPRRPPSTLSVGRVVSLIVKGLIAILVLDMAQFVFATLGHKVPILGLTAIIVGVYSAWFVVLPLAGAVLAWIAWRVWPGRFGMAVVAIGVLAALGATFITARMVQSVEAAGADIDIPGLLTLAPIDGGKPDASPVYLTDDDGQDLNVDVYRPAGETTNAPVLLYIHGGGWTKGTQADRAADMRWFADQGFLTLSVEFTLSSSTKHLWDVTQGQIGCSLSWVTKNASKYGGDPSRLSISGDSAGGTLAINTAYLQAADKLPSACGGEAPTVSAVSVTYPGVDVKATHDFSDAGAGYATKYIGGTPEEYPERYAAAGSFNKITASAPPTLILAGKVDHVVPPKTILRFAAATRKAGIETKLVRIPYAAHGFDVVSGNVGDQAFRQLTVNWLTKHGQKP